MANKWGRSHLISNQRPRTITWILIAASIFSLVYFTRMALSFGMQPLSLIVPIWYFSVTGAVWGVLGAAIFGGFVLRRPWAAHVLRWGSIAYALWYWIDKLFLVRAEYPLGSWPFSLVITVCGLAFIFWSLQRPQMRSYLQKEER
jgi:hypothetical protein